MKIYCINFSQLPLRSLRRKKAKRKKEKKSKIKGKKKNYMNREQLLENQFPKTAFF